MSIPAEHVRQLAHLARLELSDTTLVARSGELSRVLDHLEVVLKAHAQGSRGTPADPAPMRREDIASPRPANPPGLLAAPDQQDGCFRVPRVLAEG